MVKIRDNIKVRKDVHNLRSRILNYAILVELQLGDFIGKYFVKEKDKNAKFGELILNKEFFTFEQKIRIFKKLIEEDENLKIRHFSVVEYDLSNNKKEFIKKIEYIREIRNIVAHNHPFTNESGEFYVEYKSGKKTKELILNELFDKKFFKIYMEVYDALFVLLKDF